MRVIRYLINAVFMREDLFTIKHALPEPFILVLSRFY